MLSISVFVFIFSSLILSILSPAYIPACSAAKSGIVESTTVDTLFPIDAIIIKYTNIPKTIFTVAPAATIAILFGILALLKARSSSDLVSSPSSLTNPPNGINLNSYFVSFPCFVQIFGPNPIANSCTFTLNNFAIKK